MQTKVQKCFGYMKCGEILRPPAESYQRPYVLKCLNCDETYLFFEAFLFHIEDHCEGAIKNDEAPNNFAEISDNSLSNSAVKWQTELGESIQAIDFNVKVEGNEQAMSTVDPLIVVKHEYEDFSVDKNLKTVDKSTYENNDSGNKCNNLPIVKKVCGTDASRENAVDDTEINNEDIENSSDNSFSYCQDEDYEITTMAKEEYEANQGHSTFVNDFIESKSNVKALIMAYKKQPILWNKSFPFLRQKLKRQNCLQEIAHELNEQHNIEITWKQVASVVVFLCQKYREDLKCTKESKSEEKKYIPSWFFEDLSFLKAFMENNHMAKLDSDLPDLLPEQIIEILEIYRDFPSLWNTDLIEHYSNNKTNAAMQEITQLIQTRMNLEVSENMLKTYFNAINKYFTRAKRNKANQINKGSNNSVSENVAQNDYYEHMLFLYDHVGFFNCPDCKRSFQSPLYLKLHRNQMHGSEPLSCCLCKKTFQTTSSYRNHAKRHMEDLNHECKECGKKFIHAYELRVHMRQHTNTKPFCCEICGTSFRHIQSFKHHHRRHIKNYLHYCNLCGQGFYTKDRYNDHMNSHSNTRNHKCNECGKAFITKKSLQQHAVIHDDVRRHACKICGKTFKHKTGVIQHMRTHGIAKSEEKCNNIITSLTKE